MMVAMLEFTDIYFAFNYNNHTHTHTKKIKLIHGGGNEVAFSFQDIATSKSILIEYTSSESSTFVLDMV